MSRRNQILTLASAVLATPVVAKAEGLPQLDFANPLTTYQVIWGVVLFVLL